MRRELRDFEEGAPLHPGAVAFAQDVAAQLKGLLVAGRSIDRIVVTGFADGIPNPGVAFSGELVPARCRRGLTGPLLNDHELAFMRGCVVLQLIQELAGQPLAGGVRWQPPLSYDEPDGGDAGYAFRKVVVEVFLSRRPPH